MNERFSVRIMRVRGECEQDCVYAEAAVCVTRMFEYSVSRLSSFSFTSTGSAASRPPSHAGPPQSKLLVVRDGVLMDG